MPGVIALPDVRRHGRDIFFQSRRLNIAIPEVGEAPPAPVREFIILIAWWRIQRLQVVNSLRLVSQSIVLCQNRVLLTAPGQIHALPFFLYQLRQVSLQTVSLDLWKSSRW